MARGFNMAVLLGNLGADPEVRETTGGDKVANMSLATTDEWKDRDGEKQTKTQWHRLVMWRGLGELAERYLEKGSRLLVVGKVEYGQYEDKGITRYTTQVNVREMVMLSGQAAGMEAADAGSDEEDGEEDFEEDEDYDEDDLPF
jgi:single-strand DNA-binding protein